jgi:hypothetical protein
VHYGGRRHIERLTDVLIALGDTAEGEPNPAQRAALDALHAALLCHAKPVRLPPDFVAQHALASIDWREVCPVGSN